MNYSSRSRLAAIFFIGGGEMSDIYREKFERVLPAPIHWSVAFGSNVKLGENVVIDSGVTIGNNVFIGHNTVIRNGVRIGDNSVIGHLVVIESDTEIGQNVTIQSQCHITKLAIIGDSCFFGPKAMCINTQHISHGRNFKPELKGPIFEFGCRVGSGAIIMPGIKIGREAEIGAGSLVTKNCDPFTVYFGSPAKKIRRIKEEEYY